MKERYADEKITDMDGVKIDFQDSWVHLRKSNTEPIIRIYAEAPTMEAAERLGEKSEVCDCISRLIRADCSQSK